MQRRGSQKDRKPFHLILLAKTNEGYKNLVKIASAAHTKGFYYKPRIDKTILAECSEGLIALSACLHGEIPRLIQAGRMEKAAETARAYEAMFGEGNFFLSIFPLGVS